MSATLVHMDTGVPAGTDLIFDIKDAGYKGSQDILSVTIGYQLAPS